MKTEICERHRKELLKFLLLKTAPVRSGIKPGALLRVRHCYSAKNSEGFQFCLYRSDIYDILHLDYLELSSDESGSLVLFYHPETLAQTLKCAENRAILSSCNYPPEEGITVLLDFLKKRFLEEKIPHEIGVFIGYPAKDVAGFIARLPRTPVHKADWAVFGDAEESLIRMNLYRHVENFARGIFDLCDDLQTFFECINREFSSKNT